MTGPATFWMGRRVGTAKAGSTNKRAEVAMAKDFIFKGVMRCESGYEDEDESLRINYPNFYTSGGLRFSVKKVLAVIVTV